MHNVKIMKYFLQKIPQNYSNFQEKEVDNMSTMGGGIVLNLKGNYTLKIDKTRHIKLVE